MDLHFPIPLRIPLDLCPFRCVAVNESPQASPNWCAVHVRRGGCLWGGVYAVGGHSPEQGFVESRKSLLYRGVRAVLTAQPKWYLPILFISFSLLSWCLLLLLAVVLLLLNLISPCCVPCVFVLVLLWKFICLVYWFWRRRILSCMKERSPPVSQT